MRNDSNTITGSQTNNTAGTDEVLFITQIAFYCVISIVGSLANVIICVGLSRGRLKSSEYFILNLAIADLLVCAIGIPLDIYQQYAGSWPYGPFLCHVIYPSQTLLILISILTLMGMSLERHRAICSPLKQRLKSKWIRVSIVFIWLIAIAAVVPYAKALKYADNDCGETEWPVEENAKYYTLALFIIDYCIPLTIISYCYVRAGYVLNTKFKKFNRKESTSIKQNIATMKRLQQNKKVIKIFSTAVIIFVICVLPGDCYWMWMSFRGYDYHPYDNVLYAFTTIMLYANSAINPFIFGAVQMICHKNLKSRFFTESVTNTTGLSRSKGSGSSVGMGEGMHRNSFSRTAVRKKINYTSLNTRNEEPNAKVETKDFNNTIQGTHNTKLRCSETEKRLCDTSEDCRDKNQQFRDTNQEQQDTNNLCDTNQKSQFRCDTTQAECDTNQPQRDTNKEQRDTNHPQRDTDQASQCKSNETSHDAGSISSDSSATLHRDSDTFSLTSETVHNTNCDLIELVDNTSCQCYNTEERNVQHALQENLIETKDLEPNTLENARLPEHDMSKSTENELKNTKTDHGILAKSGKCEKENSSDFSGRTEFGLDKNCNISEFIRETDL